MKRRFLKSITLIGYKSIRELHDFKLRAGLNVLIGANGSGKTNFIRFFEMLGHILDSSKGLQNYVSAKGRADAFLFRGVKTTQEFQACLKFGRNQYKFTLRAADDRSLFFAHESAPFDYRTLKSNDQGSGHLESKIPVVTQRKKASLQWVMGTIGNWKVYHFHDTSPSAPIMGLSNIIDNKVLHSNAANLAPFLMNLERENPEHYDRIVRKIRSVAPFFGKFVLRDTAGQTQLLWQDHYSDLLYYPHQFSDGTLRFICLTTLLLQPNLPDMLILDEPELGLHPFAIRRLVEMLKEAAEQIQLIISTQSSLLLDELTPEQIIVVDHDEGETTLKHLNSDELNHWLEEYTLGQLWEKNIFGGTP
jgi:predicted ATPase